MKKMSYLQKLFLVKKKAIKHLPCHPKYITTIQSTLSEALSEWQENSKANELVFLRGRFA